MCSLVHYRTLERLRRLPSIRISKAVSAPKLGGEGLEYVYGHVACTIDLTKCDYESVIQATKSCYGRKVMSREH